MGKPVQLTAAVSAVAGAAIGVVLVVSCGHGPASVGAQTTTVSRVKTADTDIDQRVSANTCISASNCPFEFMDFTMNGLSTLNESTGVGIPTACTRLVCTVIPGPFVLTDIFAPGVPLKVFSAPASVNIATTEPVTYQRFFLTMSSASTAQHNVLRGGRYHVTASEKLYICESDFQNPLVCPTSSQLSISLVPAAFSGFRPY